ncbi:hypothetical protein FEE95_10055 [Maribacter algarum]|uniref:ABM domain-containing protein n=1 Tax=Maribacter algarum (ex Zhang et al. 2020) TaxID=2578118 RepID=A0A5S3QH22_9FLAO|nr:hypothetical protein [Maribacter algarum]TMM56835.1 hypothetical protein FEE95_10055 [Maribacter algarum]
MKLTVIFLISTLVLTSQKKTEPVKPYVIEVTTFKYIATVNAETFWVADAELEADYTSVQPGFISRESGFSQTTGEVVVVVRWKTMADAEASMQKFITDKSVTTYAKMIDVKTMKMNRYSVH